MRLNKYFHCSLITIFFLTSLHTLKQWEGNHNFISSPFISFQTSSSSICSTGLSLVQFYIVSQDESPHWFSALFLMRELLCLAVIPNIPLFYRLFKYFSLQQASLCSPTFPLYSHHLSIFPPNFLLQKTGCFSLLLTINEQIRLWCQQDTNHMPAPRRSNAIYTHYKALSCDYGGMLIKLFCEDRAGRVALCLSGQSEGIKRLHNYNGGMRASEWVVRVYNMCDGRDECVCGHVNAVMWACVYEWFWSKFNVRMCMYFCGFICVPGL